jgi:hypothetical protein
MISLPPPNRITKFLARVLLHWSRCAKGHQARRGNAME